MSLKIIKITVNTAENSHKDRLFFLHDREKMIDNLMERFSRPSAFYKKDVLPLMLDELKKDYPKVYEKVKDTKWSWNQYAGCPCGCSPGFVSNTKNRFQLFVTFKSI